MKFKNYTEALDNPYEYEKDQSKPDYVQFGFTTDQDIFYLVTLIGYQGKISKSCLVVFETEQGEMGLTNKGDAFRVLATVKDILISEKSFLKKYEIVYFKADIKESGRVRLYKRLVKMMGKALGAKVTEKKDKYNMSYYISNDLEKVKELSQNEKEV